MRTFLNKTVKVPVRYLPKGLSRKDKEKQKKMLLKSRKMYKKGDYFTRKKLASFKSKPSNHVSNAKEIYKVDNIAPNAELAKATGCSVDALEKIVKKGEGAYFSSGSRPNQTAQSWGYARLASSVTGGNASLVDYSILKEGCTSNSRALRLANRLKKKNSLLK